MAKEATSLTQDNSFLEAQILIKVYSNILLFNNRIVIPTPLCKDVMERIYQGHQGIELAG